MEKTVNIDNFIGVYDGYITPEECNKAIELFNQQDKMKKTFNRITSENGRPTTDIQDQHYFAKIPHFLLLSCRDHQIASFSNKHSWLLGSLRG